GGQRNGGTMTAANPEAVGSARNWPEICRAIDLPELIDDSRFADDATRIDNRDTLHDLMSDKLRQQPASHWINVLQQASIPCSTVENVASIAQSPTAEEYAAFSSVENRNGRAMQFARNPIASPDLKESAAPSLGQHNAEILAELGYSKSDIASLSTTE
ncbi:MAG: CoA transferase, partial [Pseudomonadota bacterium]